MQYSVDQLPWILICHMTASLGSCVLTISWKVAIRLAPLAVIVNSEGRESWSRLGFKTCLVLVSIRMKSVLSQPCLIRKFFNSIGIINHGLWVPRLISHLYKQSHTAFMSFNANLVSPTKEPHLESFTHNLHSLIPFMRSEALTFMVGRYISPPLLVSPLSCMVMALAN